MSILKVNSIEAATPGSEDYFLNRAWVNFNGTGTIAIRTDGNVSSLTDRGVGRYTVTYTNALTSADHMTNSDNANSYQTASVVPYHSAASSPGSTALAYVETGTEVSGNTSYGDQVYVCLFAIV